MSVNADEFGREHVASILLAFTLLDEDDESSGEVPVTSHIRNDAGEVFF